METKIKIRNEAELCIIDIEGVIGVPEESQFGDDSQRVATYDRFRTMLEQLRAVDAEEVVVNISSKTARVKPTCSFAYARKKSPPSCGKVLLLFIAY